jgi:hypothetical protein
MKDNIFKAAMQDADKSLKSLWNVLFGGQTEDVGPGVPSSTIGEIPKLRAEIRELNRQIKKLTQLLASSSQP